MPTFAIDRVNYRDFRETICAELLGLDVICDVDLDVSTLLSLLPLDDAFVMRVDNHGAPIAGVRGAHHVAADRRPPGWLLGCAHAGVAEVHTEHGSLFSPASRMHLTRALQTGRSILGRGTSASVVFLPDALIRAVLGTDLELPPLVDLPPHQGAGAVLWSCVASASGELTQCSPRARTEVVRALIHLVAASTAPSTTTREQAQPAIREVQRRRALQFMEEHLADPRLTPSQVALSLGVSLRYLYALFADQALSVAGTILERRLTRCHEALVNADWAHRSVSEIAFSWGFNDASHFARVFRRRFGVTPREVRVEASRLGGGHALHAQGGKLPIAALRDQDLPAASFCPEN